MELVFLALALIGAFGLGWFLNQRRVLKARPGPEAVQVGPGHPVLELRRERVQDGPLTVEGLVPVPVGDGHEHVVRKLNGPALEDGEPLEIWECADGHEVKRVVGELVSSGVWWDYIYDGERRDWGPRT